MIDWAAPFLDRDAALAKVKAELRADQRRLTDAEVDLLAHVAIALRAPCEPLPHRSFDVLPRADVSSLFLAPPNIGLDESSSRS